MELYPQGCVSGHGGKAVEINLLYIQMRFSNLVLGTIPRFFEFHMIVQGTIHNPRGHFMGRGGFYFCLHSVLEICYCKDNSLQVGRKGGTFFNNF